MFDRPTRSLPRQIVLGQAGVAVEVHQDVKLADLERRDRLGEFAHDRALGPHDRNPVAEPGIVPWQARRVCRSGCGQGLRSVGGS